MKILHAFNGTKHRVVLRLDDGASKAGAWASITEPARFAVKPDESIVLVTRYCLSPVFRDPQTVYRVEELGRLDEPGGSEPGPEGWRKAE